MNCEIPISRSVPRTGATVPGINLGFFALLAAVPVAALLHTLYFAFPGRPDHAIAASAVAGAALMFVGLVLVAILKRPISPQDAGLTMVSTVAVLLTASYVFWLWFYIRFPADILMYAESDYVGNIIKWRVGYPLYTDAANNESQVYPPFSSLLTYLLARAFGHGASVPAFRMVQLAYTLGAAILTTLGWKRLMQLGGTQHHAKNPLWNVFILPVLVLVASNYVTNPFAQSLHPDALVQLTVAVAYWLMLTHAATDDRRLLIPMALLPGIAFLVKQNMGIWALLFTGYVAFSEWRRSRRTVLAFAVVAFGGIGLAICAGYLVWGSPFTYWVLQLLAGHGNSIVRVVEHLREGWVYLLAGLVGGAVLLRERGAERLLAPWLVWILLYASEIYTSGIGYPLSHMGPGSLIAAAWFLAALPALWAQLGSSGAITSRPLQWLLGGICMPVAVIALLQGFAVVRMPLPPFSDDAYRYIAEVEREFSLQPTGCTLLDAGSWVYLKDGVVMKDRAPAIGDRGMDGSGDFSAVRKRIAEHRYCKILVRNYDSDLFWYDFGAWRKSSGIRKVLLENYQEAGTIHAVRSLPIRTELLSGVGAFIFFDRITILVPRPAGTTRTHADPPGGPI